MSLSEFKVQSGSVIAQRLFDICYSIDLVQAETLWADRKGGKTSRSHLGKTPAKALTFDVPPLVINLECVVIHLAGVDRPVEVSVRIYDFGVVAVSLRIDARDLTWFEFGELFDVVDKTIGPLAQSQVWSELLAGICPTLTPAMVRPNVLRLQEDYLLAVVREWDQPMIAADLLNQLNLAPLLSGEKRPLSESERQELLRHNFSYYEDDLVVLNWDRAFIYEPRGDTEVCDILEVANAQLLEFRYYDELLDAELPRMYDLVEATRRKTSLLSSRRFANLARKLYTLVAEVTELTEKVDNALQVTEDVYLARIYQSALKVFRVPQVSAAVDRKLSIIRDTYTALFDEASGARGELLEIAVIILIVIEIIVALLNIHLR
jgi:hypothetical protein